jgi:hypothetical protein
MVLGHAVASLRQRVLWTLDLVARTTCPTSFSRMLASTCGHASVGNLGTEPFRWTSNSSFNADYSHLRFLRAVKVKHVHRTKIIASREIRCRVYLGMHHGSRLELTRFRGRVVC